MYDETAPPGSYATVPLAQGQRMRDNEEMAEITFQNNLAVHTSGNLPAVGSKLPAFSVLDADLAEVTGSQFAGKNIILNIFPSVDTSVCATSVRTFNKDAAALDNAEGIENVITTSAFRSSFGRDFGVTMTDGPLEGLLARAVVVVNPAGEVVYTELVPEITNEPNYEAALAALK